MEKGPFAIQLATGGYYVGMAPNGEVIVTGMAKDATHYATRWEALLELKRGEIKPIPAFSMARIVPAPESK